METKVAIENLIVIVSNKQTKLPQMSIEESMAVIESIKSVKERLKSEKEEGKKQKKEKK